MKDVIDRLQGAGAPLINNPLSEFWPIFGQFRSKSTQSILCSWGCRNPHLWSIEGEFWTWTSEFTCGWFCLPIDSLLHCGLWMERKWCVDHPLLSRHFFWFFLESVLCRYTQCFIVNNLSPAGSASRSHIAEKLGKGTAKYSTGYMPKYDIDFSLSAYARCAPVESLIY